MWPKKKCIAYYSCITFFVFVLFLTHTFFVTRVIFFVFFSFFYCCSITVVPIFLPLLSLALSTTSHIQSSPPLSLSMSPLYMFLDLPLPLLFTIIPLLPPLWSLSVCFLFSVSGSILLMCLFCWLASTYGWDHVVFVFHHLAYFT